MNLIRINIPTLLLLLFIVPEAIKTIHYYFDHHATRQVAYEAIDHPVESSCPFQHVFYYPYAVVFGFFSRAFVPVLKQVISEGQVSAMIAGELQFNSTRAPPKLLKFV
jgi:hypothetical protein